MFIVVSASIGVLILVAKVWQEPKRRFVGRRSGKRWFGKRSFGGEVFRGEAAGQGDKP